MYTHTDPYAAGSTLDSLRAQCGDSEFGYRLQALLALVMANLGAGIVAINAQGHPDIEANWLNKRMLVQVKTLLHRYAEHRYELSEADLRGIRPESPKDAGYLALLDCAPPAEWIFVEHDRVKHHLHRPIHTVTLRADADRTISDMCTTEFTKTVEQYRERLHDMTYGLLCKRALALAP